MAPFEAQALLGRLEQLEQRIDGSAFGRFVVVAAVQHQFGGADVRREVKRIDPRIGEVQVSALLFRPYFMDFGARAGAPLSR